MEKLEQNEHDYGLKIWDSEKIWTPGAGLPPLHGNKHVNLYHHNIPLPHASCKVSKS